MDLKILVIGSLGFVGRSLIQSFLPKQRLETQQYQVVGLDNFSHDYQKYNDFKNKNYKFYLADIKDQHIFNRILELENPDFVINTVEDLSASTYDSLILASTKYNYKFISICNYTNTFHNLITDSNILLFRHCNLFGQRQSLNNILPQTITNILNEKPTIINKYEDHEWLYIDDFVSAIQLAISKNAVGSFDISAGFEMSNVEFVNKIYSIFKTPLNIQTKTQLRTSNTCDATQIKELGWQPKYKFTEALADSIAWYRGNNWWFR